MQTRRKVFIPSFSLILLIPLLIIPTILVPFSTDGMLFKAPSNSAFIPKLRDSEIGIVKNPLTGIVDETGYKSPSHYSIAEIVDKAASYYPGESIRIRNRFSSAQTGTWAVVSQVIQIFLHEADYTNLTDIDHLVTTAVTNGSVAVGEAAISPNADEGWIDITFTIPDLSNLSTNYGIAPGDNVSIYQYYPGGSENTTSKLDNILPMEFTDYFDLSGYSTVYPVGDGFINPASGNNSFRQGENASAILKATSGTDNVPNVNITVTLHYIGTNVTINNNSNGMTYFLRDVVSGNPSTETDANGEIELIILTSPTLTAEDDYFFNVTGDFNGTGYVTPNYNPLIPGSNIAVGYAPFTVINHMDRVYLDLISITPSPLEPPNAESTIITYRVRIEFAYGGAYYLSGLPVNATLDNYPSGVSLSIATGFLPNVTAPGWYYTNSTGYIAFNITAVFPILFNNTIATITTTVNLVNSNAPDPPYPTSYPSSPHRFLRNDTNGLNVVDIQTLSINPDFWVGQIGFYTANTTSIRPGETALLEFEINSTQAPGIPFNGVPVNFTVNPSIAGVFLSISGYVSYGSDYYRTDVNGRIEVKVHTTYLLTPEVLRTITLDIIVDFQNDSQARWIGPNHAGYDTFLNFDNTWLTSQSTDAEIDPQFIFCDIIESATNESDDTTIRSGDALIVTYTVQTTGGTPLSNVPVNISIINPHLTPGVSLSMHEHGGPYIPDPDWYYTNASGKVAVTVLTTYGVTPKDNFRINLTAFANFEWDLQSVWYIGETPSSGDFRSNQSWSWENSEIDVDSQYFFGGVRVSPLGTYPNSTLVQQSEALEIQFQLYLSYEGTNISSSYNGIDISIEINNSHPSTYHMTVTPTITQTTVGSLVTYIILTNTTGITPEAQYTITAIANFGAAQGLTYNLSHSTVPSGKLLGRWVNGTIANVNSSVNQMFEVKNSERILTQISGLFDPNHGDEGFFGGFYEVYRGTTQITVSGSYTDSTLQPVSFQDLIISINTSLGPNPIDISSVGDVTTDAQGDFSHIVTLPLGTPLEDITIYARDSVVNVPEEQRVGVSNIRVVTTVDLSDYTRTDPYNGSAIFTGSGVTVSGTILDDQGSVIDSAELTNHLRVIGWNTTHEIGIATIGSPGAGTGAYTLAYAVPSSYTGNSISIRLNVSSATHYRANYSDITVNVYSNILISDLKIFFPDNGNDLSLSNNTLYVIPELANRSFNIRGTLRDNFGRILDNKEIRDTWNSLSTRRSGIPTGYFDISYSFPGWMNGSWDWEFAHISDEGILAPSSYAVSLQWEIYDRTEPDITIISPSPFDSGALANQTFTLITVTVTDPDDADAPGYVSVGLNSSSIYITINGTSYQMGVAGVDTYSYNWDTSNSLDGIYFIEITADDDANNHGTTGLLTVVIDVLKPTATINATTIIGVGSIEYAAIDNFGNIIITGSLDDSSSITSRDSGINPTTIQLIIQPSGDLPELILSYADFFVATTTYFQYNWSIFDPMTGIRDTRFSTENDWEIIVSITDIAGNEYSTTLDLLLENTLPGMAFSLQPPGVINQETFEVVVGYSDGHCGIKIDLINFTIFNALTDAVVDEMSYTIGDAEITEWNLTVSSLELAKSDFENGDYYIVAKVYDFNGNQGSANSTTFAIVQFTSTTTTTPTTPTTPTSPAGPPLQPIDLVQFLFLDIIALISGVGIAVLFERIKSRRKG